MDITVPSIELPSVLRIPLQSFDTLHYVVLVGGRGTYIQLQGSSLHELVDAQGRGVFVGEIMIYHHDENGHRSLEKKRPLQSLNLFLASLEF